MKPVSATGRNQQARSICCSNRIRSSGNTILLFQIRLNQIRELLSERVVWLMNTQSAALKTGNDSVNVNLADLVPPEASDVHGVIGQNRKPRFEPAEQVKNAPLVKNRLLANVDAGFHLLFREFAIINLVMAFP